MPGQPADMKSENGVILTVGMFVNDESFEIVFPAVTDATTLIPSNLCIDATDSFQADPIAKLQLIVSSSGYISFVQATGMMLGRIPSRVAFSPADLPGMAPPNALPTQVCGLGLIYQDPADRTGTDKKIRSARTFFSGISSEEVVGNQINPSLSDNILTFLTALQEGWESSNAAGFKWYRVLDVPKPTTSTQPVKRLLAAQVRGGIYTQKRRLTPRQS